MTEPINNLNFLVVTDILIDRARQNALDKLDAYSKSPDRFPEFDDTLIRNFVKEFFKEAESSMVKACEGQDFKCRIWLRIEKLKSDEYCSFQEKMEKILEALPQS